MEIRIDPLSLTSINEAKKQIRKYAKNLPKRCEELARRLAELGTEVADSTFSISVYDLDAHYHQPIEPTNITVTFQQDHDHNGHFTIHADGEAVAFVEFGAGVYFNSNDWGRPRPEGIVGIGEYGMGNGKQRSWGFYGSDGKAHVTAGTPEQPGMWYASQEMRNKLTQIAREVFAE